MTGNIQEAETLIDKIRSYTIANNFQFPELNRRRKRYSRFCPDARFWRQVAYILAGRISEFFSCSSQNQDASFDTTDVEEASMDTDDESGSETTGTAHMIGDAGQSADKGDPYLPVGAAQ